MIMQRIDPFREFRKLDELLTRAWQGDGDGHLCAGYICAKLYLCQVVSV